MLLLYYAKNLPEVKAIVESFKGFGIVVNQAKVSLQITANSLQTTLATQLLKIKDPRECLVKLREAMVNAK